MPWDFSDQLDEALALRSLSDPADARVKAWRRQYREGCLPPVLVMWIAGFARYVVLDGHDRILAALLEGGAPPVVALLNIRHEPRQIDVQTQATMSDVVARQLAAAANPDLQPRRPFTVASANRLLVEAYDDRPLAAATTRAWPLEGGQPRWLQEVREQRARIPEDVFAALTRRP